MNRRHAVLVHPSLSFSGSTERLFATAQALEGQGVRVTVVSTPGSRAHALAEAGFEPLFAELPTQPHRAPFEVWRTARLLRSLEPTVLQYTDESLCSLAAALARGLRLPYVVEVHHPVEHRLEEAPAHLEGVVATSESMVEGIVNHGRIPREKIRVIRHSPHPLPLDTPGPFEREGPPRVGTAGFLDSNHDTEWFLEAARTLARSDRTYSFVVFGEGPREVALRRAIRNANLTEHVTLAVPTTADVRQSVAALDVFVSCRLRGGPSWISCQALAQGVPSIFAASGEAFHLVRDRTSGVLTEPGNGRRLAEEIQLMAENPAFARKMGARGREQLLEGSPPERFDREVAETFAVAEGLAVAR